MRKPPELSIASASPAATAPARQKRGFAPSGGRGRGRAAARQAHVISDCEFQLPDPRLWKAQFPAIWRQFLIDRFGDDPHAVKDGIGCNLQTARNWLDGLHVPTGDAVARQMLHWRRELIAAALKVGAGKPE